MGDNTDAANGVIIWPAAKCYFYIRSIDRLRSSVYTDTHGYDEINFAAFFLNMLFCPRIRHMHRQRIGQFHAAFPAGHKTASAALQRLDRFPNSNRFHAANRELGRVLKTEFLLKYMLEPELRIRVRRGLLKVEQLHAMARAVYYGQLGRISAREVYEQMKTCSCLTLIQACKIYWQAREITRLTAAPDFPFDPELIRHISPIEWKNVILYGEIKIDPEKLVMRRA